MSPVLTLGAKSGRTVVEKIWTLPSMGAEPHEF